MPKKCFKIFNRLEENEGQQSTSAGSKTERVVHEYITLSNYNVLPKLCAHIIWFVVNISWLKIVYTKDELYFTIN